jgi:hypothetical protein
MANFCARFFMCLWFSETITDTWMLSEMRKSMPKKKTIEVGSFILVRREITTKNPSQKEANNMNIPPTSHKTDSFSDNFFLLTSSRIMNMIITETAKENIL